MTTYVFRKHSGHISIKRNLGAVSYGIKPVVTGKTIAGIPLAEDGGDDKSKLVFWGANVSCANNANAVKKIVRSPRPQELEKLKEIELQIYNLEKHRRAIEEELFSKGRIVTMEEIVSKITNRDN